MRRCWLCAVLSFATATTAARGQAVAPVPPVPTPPTIDPPPLLLPANSDPVAGVPNGTPVSRPLQPVTLDVPPSAQTPAPAPATPLAPKDTTPDPANPLGRSWETLEFLLWWTKPQPLPPLVTAGPPGTLPVLGGPNTRLLAGGRSLDSQPTGGMRATVGWAFDDSQTYGVEATYLFLGTRTYSASYSDAPGLPAQVLGRPFVNAATGREDAIPVAVPGVVDGLVTVSTSTRVTGWEVGGVANLYAGPRARLDVTAGYRYFMVNEGLRVEQTSSRLPVSPAVPEILSASADQIDAHNRFHGAQIGLHGDFSHGPVFVQIVGKTAFGETIEIAKLSGQTTVITAGSPLPMIQSYNAGVLGLPTNSGRATNSTFAVLPEVQFKLGCKLGDGVRFYVGYNFLFLSQAIRPGDQVDRTLAPGQIPTAATQSAAAVLTSDRPQLVMSRADYWVQGLMFGMEWRY